MGTYETLNEVLVSLFRDVNDIEQKAIITSEFEDITNNDMHVINAIGVGTTKNMSSIAKELSVTVGTLTISMNSLVKKRLCDSLPQYAGSPGGSYFSFGKRCQSLLSSQTFP